MARLLDRIVVVDVESTCWEGRPPKGQASEIIEVGVCLLDVRSLERSEKRSYFVRPRMSRLSAFCTQLTGIRPEDVASAPPLEEVVRELRARYRTRERLWASYGDYDRRQFERNCAAYGIEYPFGPGHLNVKTLFAVTLGLSVERNLAEACMRLGIPFEGRQHRGGDDAWNIARVLGTLLAAGRSGVEALR